MKNEKCQVDDYALAEAARTSLRRGNAVICKCAHCRQQGTTSIKHTAQCCFYPKAKVTHRFGR